MQRIVFIGIGGIWLSAIAHIMLDCGITHIIWIDGNIHQDSLQSLKKMWVELYEHGVIKCKSDDIVLYSDAVFSSVEYKAYKELWSTMYSYFTFAWAISKYFRTISVAWSHGKSTTTAIGISALHKLVPNFALGIVWTLMKEFNGANYYINSDYFEYTKQVIHTIISWSQAEICNPDLYNASLQHSDTNNKSLQPLFIIEADEFNRHFHLLETDIALITNIEHDHTDIYPSKQDYLDAFQLFVDKTTSAIITHPNTMSSLHHSEEDKEQDIFENASHKIYTKWNHFNFQYVFWDHNQSNANLILSLCEYLWTEPGKASYIIEQFPGIRRRQELLLKTQHGALYSDYAHHPTEINATCKALRSQFPNKKIIWIFQPHQAARVLEFEKEFVDSVSNFDSCLIFPIYAARENFESLWEKYPELAHSGSFYEYSKLFAHKCGAEFMDSYDEARKLIQERTSNTIVVIMTAGNLDWEIRRRMLNN